MDIDLIASELLWSYYQRGCHCLVRNGLYFRQVLRPPLSHVYFQRAMPLLKEYSRANRGRGDLPPSFGDQLQSCPLTLRDLIHLDYAISLGYTETVNDRCSVGSGAQLLDWPGPDEFADFVAVDVANPLQKKIPNFVEEQVLDHLDDEEEDEYEDLDDRGRSGDFDL